MPARIGDQVSEDTVVSTGFKSTALIEVGSALLAVRPLTRLTLTEISASAGNETLNVNLAAGRVRVDLNPPAGSSVGNYGMALDPVSLGRSGLSPMQPVGTSPGGIGGGAGVGSPEPGPGGPGPSEPSKPSGPGGLGGGSGNPGGSDDGGAGVDVDFQ